MTKGFRDIDQEIDDRTLVDLEGLTRDDLNQTLRASLPPQAARRVINRLHNKQHQKKAKTIKAFQLTGQGFEPMAEIDIDVNEFSAHGKITNAVDIGNADSIAITILGKNYRETTYLVGREDPVRIWKMEYHAGRIVPPAPDYDRTVEHGFLSAQYIAEHLNTFFGKRMSIKNQATGTLRTVEVFAEDQGAFHFTLDGTICRVAKTDLVQVHRELEPGYRVPGAYPWGAPRPGTPSVVRQVERGIEAAERREESRRRTMRRPTAARPSTLGPAMARFADAFTVPNDRPDYTVTAYSVAVRTDVEYRGMKISLRLGKIKGVLTDFHLDSEGKVVLVVDGQLYKCNYGEVVRLWKKES